MSDLHERRPRSQYSLLAQAESLVQPGTLATQAPVKALQKAPGHASSHFSFLEETSRTLISGDLVSTLGTVIINPPDGNMADYLRSIEVVRELGATALVPGHGPPSRGVDRLLASLLAHRHEREAKILRALADGPMSEDALREEVYKDTPGAAAALAARTLEAHILKLIDEGKVRRDGDNISSLR